MQKWKGKLIKHICEELKVDKDWQNEYRKLKQQTIGIGIHLAIFNEPYLTLIFDGKKKVESRFSRNKTGPYRKVCRGDIIILKKSGGPVLGLFTAGDVLYYENLTTEICLQIEYKYGSKIGTQYDHNFWTSRTNSKYSTLIEIGKLKKLTPLWISKKDRTAWVVLTNNTNQTLFENEAI